MERKPTVYPPLTDVYAENVVLMDGLLRVEESFDLIKKAPQGREGRRDLILY